LSLNQFAANQSVSFPSAFEALSSNLTLSFWALPAKSQLLPSESNTASISTSQLQLLISSQSFDESSKLSGLYIAVSTNGVVVFETQAGNSYALLVADLSITSWSYLSIIVQNNMPSLFINGVFVRQGLPSTGTCALDLASFGLGYSGALDNVVVHDIALTPSFALELYLFQKSQGLNELSFLYSVILSDLAGASSAFLFDEGAGLLTYDFNSDKTASLVNMDQSNWIQGVSEYALQFQSDSNLSQTDYLALSQAVQVSTTFTIDFWAFARKSIVVEQESITGSSLLLSNQSFLLSPFNSNVEANSSLYVSVGSNGLAVYSRTNFSFSAILVYPGLFLKPWISNAHLYIVDLSGWTKITILCNRNVVSLYINGQPARIAVDQNLAVSMSISLIGANTFSAFDGAIDELQVYPAALSPFSITALYELSQLSCLHSARSLCITHPYSPVFVVELR
jgi:hypothetical protein